MSRAYLPPVRYIHSLSCSSSVFFLDNLAVNWSTEGAIGIRIWALSAFCEVLQVVSSNIIHTCVSFSCKLGARDSSRLRLHDA